MAETIQEYVAQSKKRGREQKILRKAAEGMKREGKTSIKSLYKNLPFTKNKKKMSSNKSKNKSSVFKKATKAFGYRKEASRNLLAFANAFGGSQRVSRSGAVRPVGRPRGSLKHRSPFTGQPIPATEFYRQMRKVREIESQRADQVNQRQIQKFAQQGVQPRQIQTTVMERLKEQFLRQQQMQTRSQNPYNRQIPLDKGNVVVPQRRSIWNRRGVVDQSMGPNGPKRIVRYLPQSFWNP